MVPVVKSLEIGILSKIMRGDDMMYMKNSSTVRVAGKDTVQLKFTSSKIVTLEDFLHVANTCTKSISKTLLSKYGSRIC